MGITGLIPFLEKASCTINIRQLKGSSVAVDSYCWLHKGVFACADKLIRGETTDIHIQYCLKYVDMLLRHKISIIMIFDGRHLPAKAETERRRREARNESKQLAKEYLRRNETEKALSHMRRGVDVTHEMALQLIKACRNRGVDCIVAPYEADAQLAWLNKQGLVEYIVTEDSDLTLFGAQKILFKLDLTGQALLVENTKFYLAMGCKPEKYTFDKFRRMCILSGCDYLDSLQGIGLKKACKFILITEEDDMTKALKKIPNYLNMKQLEITSEYIESFLKAEATFRHMFIYNPLERRMERLHELDEFQTDERYCINAGSLLNNNEQAFQLALGNLNPFTLKQMDDWHPNRNWPQAKCKQTNIWQSSRIPMLAESKPHSKKAAVSIFNLKNVEFKDITKIKIEENLSEEKNKLEESEIISMYKHVSAKVERKRKRSQSSSSSSEEEESEKSVDLCRTPKTCAHNPFAKVKSSFEHFRTSSVCTNSSLLKLLSPKKSKEHNRNQQTMEIEKVSVKSRFFAENIKLIEKKPLEAKDLTSEMFKIEQKVIAHTEQQQHLYYYSLESPKEIDENEQKTFDNKLSDNSYQSNKAERSEYINETSNPDRESCNSSQGTEVFEASGLKEDAILISDIEDEPYSQKFIMLPTVKNVTTKLYQNLKPKTNSQNTSRKLGKSLGSVDSKQSKLSMFGFQKRPSLKKL